jgi:hypothetical protein
MTTPKTKPSGSLTRLVRPVLVQVQAFGGDGLYADGKLATAWFTRDEYNLLLALGFTDWKCLKVSQKWYEGIERLPENLADCVLA